MSTHNLRYFGMGALVGLTALGWILDEITPEITAAVFVALGAITTADVYKHKDDGKIG